MTNEVASVVKTVEGAVEMLHRQPLAVVLVFALMALGWAIRATHWLPNRCAPLFILLVGVGANILVGDPGRVPPTHPCPKCVLGMYGMVLAAFAIVLYLLTAKRIEKYFPQDDPAGIQNTTEPKDKS